MVFFYRYFWVVVCGTALIGCRSNTPVATATLTPLVRLVTQVVTSTPLPIVTAIPVTFTAIAQVNTPRPQTPTPSLTPSATEPLANHFITPLVATATEAPAATIAIAPLATSATAWPSTTLPSLFTATPAPTVPPSVIVTSLPPAAVGAAAPQIYETTLTIPTYGYEAGFLPTTPDDPIFPYPHLDFALVTGPVSRSYRAIVLENGYVALTILPELGGRIYRWVDKATGRHLLYENPVIKPTSWGYRGWWLAAGGIEWAFPVEEHGLNEWRPWTVSTGSTAYGLSVTVSNVDDRTGMEVGATISLDGGHAYAVIQPWARNNTPESHPYQLWLNAMLAFNNNTVSGATQIILPVNEVLIHSTSDGGVPGGGGMMSWPFYGSRDMSWYSNWQGYLGFFIPDPPRGFVGIYDHALNQGIVRAFNPGWPAGSKIFGPGTLDPSYWTDDSSNYLELWSGATSSFWSYATLNAGESFSWTEYWYPVHGMGGFNEANRLAALRLQENGDQVEIAAAVSTTLNGTLTLYTGGQTVVSWPMLLYPATAFQATWTRPQGNTAPLGLRLTAQDGTIIAQTGTVP